jgi:enamine deaminase RidA (YjgF/YER057c/UK114 family)
VHGGKVESPEARLRELGLLLPAPPEPLGDYPSARLVGDLLYTTAVLPFWNGELRYVGALGSEVSLADGAAAARLCGLNLLALARASAGGSLDNIRQVVQVIGLVNSAPGFAQQSKVMNGLSELLFEVFGDAGKHNRTALATLDLPLNASVQATAVIRIDAARATQRGEAALAVSGTLVEDRQDDAAVGAMPVAGAAVERTADEGAVSAS